MASGGRPCPFFRLHPLGDTAMKTIHRTLAVAVLSLPLVIASCNNKSNSNESPQATKTSQAATVPDLSPPASDPAPAPVAAPSPAGPAAHANIGYQGGSLKSADGRIQISLPPSAVYADTDVGIQPVNTDDLDGIGPTYQLSPEGTQFNTPVTLTWQLSDADLAGRPITQATIATRDQDGAWKAQRGVQYDAAAKVVRVSTSHFSSWRATWADYLPNIAITPTQDDVSLNKSLELHVAKQDTLAGKSVPSGTQPGDSKASGGQSDNDLLTPPTKFSNGDSDKDLLQSPQLCDWKVNSIAHGNATYGYINPNQDKFGKVSPDENKAMYTAPAKIPQRNPVAVSCEMKTGHSKIMAVSNITITDKKGWSVEITYEYLNHSSSTGKTVAGVTGTNTQTEERHAYAYFHVYSDSRYASGAVGGMGKGDITNVDKSLYTVPTCRVSDAEHISGPADAEGNGTASAASQLAVTIHGDNLHGHQDHDATCGKGYVPKQDWDTASFGVSCNFTGVDYDKGGTFHADVPSDQGHGKCTVTINPM
jgi:hypothetical protein